MEDCIKRECVCVRIRRNSLKCEFKCNSVHSNAANDTLPSRIVSPTISMGFRSNNDFLSNGNVNVRPLRDTNSRLTNFIGPIPFRFFAFSASLPPTHSSCSNATPPSASVGLSSLRLVLVRTSHLISTSLGMISIRAPLTMASAKILRYLRANVLY